MSPVPSYTHLVASQSLVVASSGPDVNSSLQEVGPHLSFLRIRYFCKARAFTALLLADVVL